MRGAVTGCILLGLLAAVSAGAAETAVEGDVAVVVKAEAIPGYADLNVHDHRRVKAALERVPEGGKLRVECQTVAPDASKAIRHIIRLTPLNKAGRPEGVEEAFDDWYRKPVRSTPFVNGKRQGMERTYDRDKGSVLSETPWEKDVIQGVRRVFHPNGKVASETSFEKGIVVGQSRSFDEEGRLIRVVDYKAGKREGDSTDYWAEKPEAVQRIIPYRNDKVEGLAKSFYLSGKPKWEKPYRDNRLHGVERHFGEDGSVEKTLFWLEGREVDEAAYNKEKKP